MTDAGHEAKEYPAAAKAKKPAAKKRKKTKVVPRAVVFGDTFGVTRVVEGEALSLTTTVKVSAPRGGVTQTLDGKLVLIQGRINPKRTNYNGSALLKPPRLSAKALTGSGEPAALLETSVLGEAGVAFVSGGALVVARLEGKEAKSLREVSLTEARELSPEALGPEGSGAMVPPSRLAIDASGLFAVLTAGALTAGRIGAEEDEVLWRLPVRLHPSSPSAVTVAAGRVWLTVLDTARDEVSILSVSSEGEVERRGLASLGLPFISETHTLYQPSSHRVVRIERATAEETAFDIEAHNAHPYEAPEPTFYGDTSPPEPTRLVGELALLKDRPVLVPWHRETVVDLATGAAHSRGLEPASGPFRRGLMEIVARDNAALAPLQLRMPLRLDPVEPPKLKASVTWTPTPPALVYRIALGLAELMARYPLRSNGHSLSSMGVMRPGTSPPPPADRGELRAALEWMRHADVLPMEAMHVDGRYQREFDLRRPREASAPFTREAEGLWLRVLLETTCAGAWTDEIDLDSDAPADAALLARAVESLPRWSRLPRTNGLRLFCESLVHHCGADLLDVLFSILDIAGQGPWRDRTTRDVIGDQLHALCHRRPELTEECLRRAEASETEVLLAHHRGKIRALLPA